MKSLCCLLPLIWCLNVFGSVRTDWGTFTYVTNEMEATPSQLAPLSRGLEAMGFLRIRLPGKMGISALSWMDEMWISSTTKQAVLIKHQFQTQGEVAFGEFYQSSKGVSLHERVGEGTRLVYFHQFTMGEAKKIMTATTVNSDFHFSLISKAYAEDDCHEINFATELMKKMAPSDSLLYSVLVGGGQCAVGLLNGLWDSTGGVVVDVGVGAYHLVTTNPLVTIEKISDGIESLGKFFTNFREIMGEAGDAFDSLPADQKSKVICQVIASVGAGVAVTAITFGAAGPVVLKGMITTIQKINTHMKSAKLSKLISKLEEKQKNASEKMAFMAKHKDGKELASKFERAKVIKQEVLEASQDVVAARYAVKSKKWWIPGGKLRRERDLAEARLKVAQVKYKKAEDDIYQAKLDKTVAEFADSSFKIRMAAYYGITLSTRDAPITE